LLAIVAVFVPSFFLVGIARSLFVPLSLAVGFAMCVSYLLSNTLVPVLSTWLLREKEREAHKPDFFSKVQNWYGERISQMMSFKWWILIGYVFIIAVGVLLIGRRLGTDIFPTVDAGQFQLRLRAPAGTRVERTEEIALKALDAIRQEAGPDKVAITLAFVGAQPASYPINSIYLWTSGPQEAVLLVALRRDSRIHLAEFEERLRQKLPAILPGTNLSFEAGDIVSQVMNFGSNTPIEVAMNGPDLVANRGFAEKVMAEMSQIRTLRDIQFGQPLDYPTVNVNVDRERAGQLGVTMQQVGRSLVAATSSSRFVQPNYWLDKKSGTAYQVQIEVPQSRMKSIEDIESLPAMPDGSSRPLV